MKCIADGCSSEWDVESTQLSVVAPCMPTVSTPKVSFEVDLCRIHRDIFDASKHTLFVRSPKRRS